MTTNKKNNHQREKPLQSRYPFRPRFNLRRSSRPFSVGEEERESRREINLFGDLIAREGERWIEFEAKFATLIERERFREREITEPNDDKCPLRTVSCFP
ncbi:unnamed protein product [Brassica oleracea]|uniref:(rape) hypothetical protein n=1 Tax=Brassica napus TaxID=3708 RepID=A0A816Q1V3_BRANA|nr:unnamed protein product [Brassica napus]